MSLAQKIADVEAEMARTQKNKHTEGHLALLKAKLAKLKRELIDAGSAKGGEYPIIVKVADKDLMFQNQAKPEQDLSDSHQLGNQLFLQNKLTGTFSEAADYQFTTLTCIPGTIHYKGAKIQLLDLPGIIEGAKDGKGRGKQVIGVGRTCNLILIVLDVTKPLIQKRLIEHEVEGFGIRLNKRPPNVVFKKKDKGGLNIVKMAACPELEDDTIKSICKEYRVSNADIMIREAITDEQLIDVIQGNRVYVPAIYVLNKIDAITIEELDLLSQVPHYVPISAKDEWNFDQLLEKVWEYLDLIRIYTKPKGQIPDYTAPVVIPKKRATIEGFCNRLHKHMIAQMKYAWVWGASVKHNPQKVGKEHALVDQDIVQIVKK